MDAINIQEYGDPSVLTLVSTGPPSPSADELLIDVRAAGVNFADIEQRTGDYPAGPTPPYCPGLEVAGVIQTAPEESSFDSGDRVAALLADRYGGYAEQATAAPELAIRLPASIPFPTAVALPVQYLTAHNVLFEWGSLTATDRVLITAAAGGVGTAAVQFAGQTAATVIGVASTPAKRSTITELGADRAIPYEEIAAQAVDLVLDGVGGSAFRDALAALAPGGRIVTYGMASGQVPTVAAPRLLFDNQSLHGYHLIEAATRVPERVFQAVPTLLEGVLTGDLDVLIDRTYPLSEAATAHRRLANRETQGKLVLQP